MASQTHAVSTISAAELARTLGSARRPQIVDVRWPPAFAASQHLIYGSLDRRQRDLTTESQTWPPKELAR
jgi:hypothetical protein